VVGGTDIGRSQIRDEQPRTARHVQRQEAVVLVVAVEKMVLLLTVNEIVGGVEVEDEFGGRRVERGDELFDENFRESNVRGAVDAVFEPAKRRRRCERGGAENLGVIGGGLPERIAAKPVVIVEVFVSIGDSENALRDERALVVDGECGGTRIGDRRIDRVKESDLSICFAKEQDSRIVGKDARLEIADLATEASKQGWMNYKAAGSVVEITFPGLLSAQEEKLSNESD